MTQHMTLNNTVYRYDLFDVIDASDSFSGLFAEKLLAKFRKPKFLGWHDDYSQPKSSLATKTNTEIVYPEFYHNVRPADWVRAIHPSPEDYGDQKPIRIESVFKPLDKEKYSLLGDIFSVYNEHSEPDWDGYDAIPISEKTTDKALSFARLLPTGIPLPEVIPEPTGEMAFEWYRDKTHVFIISVGESNIVSYAGLFGKHIQAHGSEYINDHIPQTLLNHISRLSI